MLHQTNTVDEVSLLERCKPHSIEQVCMLLNLNRSNIYRHKKIQSQRLSQHEQFIVERIYALFKMSGNNYGSRRIQQALLAENIQIGRYKVRRIMKQNGLKPHRQEHL